LLGQNSAQSPPEPPEEDVSVQEAKEYVLNPLQAAKELRVGEYYFKKGSYRAAARRFEEALKWDPAAHEVYLRLGEARLKQGDPAAARTAWEKFLEAAPDSKEAAAVRKRLGKLEDKRQAAR
jgi:Tfp pilus assembly protein PilF